MINCCRPNNLLSCTQSIRLEDEMKPLNLRIDSFSAVTWWIPLWNNWSFSVLQSHCQHFRAYFLFFPFGFSAIIGSSISIRSSKLAEVEKGGNWYLFTPFALFSLSVISCSAVWSIFSCSSSWILADVLEDARLFSLLSRVARTEDVVWALWSHLNIRGAIIDLYT